MLVFALLLVLPALILADPPANLEGDLFKIVDENADGKISKTEAINYLLSFDVDTGHITAQEFATGVDKIDPVFVGHEQALFALLDKDGDGTVNTSEMEASFKLVDTNGDGELSKHEFSVAFADVVSKLGGSSA